VDVPRMDPETVEHEGPALVESGPA
jgi:hypothetical protein